MQLKIKVEGSGPPLVMVPGFACSPTVWFKVREPLAKNYELHVVTVPGFGGAPGVDPPVSPKVRDALADHCASLGGAVLLGHSYGAFLSLWTAARRPDAIRAVVAVDGLPYFPTLFDINATPEAMKSRAEKERAEMAAGSKEDLKPGPTYFDQHILDPEDAAYLNQSTPKPDPTAMGDVRYETLTTDIRPEMSRIKCPVHYIAAGLPWIKGPDDIPEIRDFYLQRIGEIAHFEFVIAKSARHFVMIDDPEFFLQEIERFITKILRQT